MVSAILTEPRGGSESEGFARLSGRCLALARSSLPVADLKMPRNVEQYLDNRARVAK
jgi:hypothetical protein